MGNTNRTVDDTELDEDAMREYFRNPDYSIQGICGKKIVKFVQKPKETNTTIYVFNIAAFFDDELGFLSHLTAWFSLYQMTDTKYRNLYEEFVKKGEEPVSAVKKVMRIIEEELDLLEKKEPGEKLGLLKEYKLWKRIDKNVHSVPSFVKPIILSLMVTAAIVGGAYIQYYISLGLTQSILLGTGAIAFVVGLLTGVLILKDKNRGEKARKKILENYNKIMQDIGITMLDESENLIEKLKNNNVIVMKIDESDSQKNEGASVELKCFKDLDNAPFLSENDKKLK